jgi:hypothetical protein
MSLLALHAGDRTVKMALAVALAGVLLAGCGGSTQDANEPNAHYTVRVLSASFPAKQAVAQPSALQLQILNPGAQTVPNIVVSVNSFYYRSEYPNLADRARPIWIVDEGPGAIPRRPVETVPFDSPGGAVTATVDTWAAGPLGPGASRTLTWRLTPVKSGMHTVRYTVAAGLGGKARAQQASGTLVIGRFNVDIAPAPPVNHVNPETGLVEPGPNPVAPGA